MSYEDPDLKERLVLNPRKGNVAFGSGKYGWGFTIGNFTKLYAKKFIVNENNIKKNFFWGENFYDPKKKMWGTDLFDKEGELLMQGFCQFILEPVIKLINTLMKKRRIKKNWGIFWQI